MHIILLKFGDNKAAAPKHMASHKAWIDKGLSDGIFQCVGSLSVGGGFILARGEDDRAIRHRVEADPFVKHKVVSAEIHGVSVDQASSAFGFLKSAE